MLITPLWTRPSSPKPTLTSCTNILLPILLKVCVPDSFVGRILSGVSVLVTIAPAFPSPAGIAIGPMLGGARRQRSNLTLTVNDRIRVRHNSHPALLLEPANSRTSARQKLTRLTRQQFQELSTDVYDELLRRTNNSAENEG